jgi:hypothetical protein
VTIDDSRKGPERSDEHPRGTLVIVGLFGLLFLVGWLLVYFLVFAARGELH